MFRTTSKTPPTRTKVPVGEHTDLKVGVNTEIGLPVATTTLDSGLTLEFESVAAIRRLMVCLEGLADVTEDLHRPWSLDDVPVLTDLGRTYLSIVPDPTAAAL